MSEWVEKEGESSIFVNEEGKQEIKIPDNLITWIFEEGTFILQAKLEGDKSYSIITNHLGTPEMAYEMRRVNVFGLESWIYEGRALRKVLVDLFSELAGLQGKAWK